MDDAHIPSLNTLTGYFNIVWFGKTNKSTSTLETWIDVDCSDVIPEGAFLVFGFMHNSSASVDHTGGVRANGASDEGDYFSMQEKSTKLFMVPLDINRVFEQKIDSTYVDCYVWGYLI